MSPRLNVDSLCGGYGDTVVVDSVSFAIAPGEVLGVLGRNGAGKTTLCRLVTGALPLGGGRIEVDGEALGDVPAHRRRARGLGYLPQSQPAFDSLSVQENLSLAPSGCAPDAYFDRFPRLAQRSAQLAGTLSGGERKILGFVRAMCEDTCVLILDEPSEGVQPENIEHMAACILERAQAGASVVLCEQNIGLLRRVSDRFLGLETGRVAKYGTAEDISESDLRALVAL